MLEYETVPFGSYERLNIVNRQIHFKAQGMWGTCRVLPGYILSIYPAHDNMNISQKLPLSSTRGKLSRLLKVTLCGATGCQRQQCLIQFFRYFSNKQKIAIFCCGYRTRSMAEAQKLPLHVCFFDIWTRSVFFGLISHQAHSAHIQLTKISTNMFGNTIPPLVW